MKNIKTKIKESTENIYSRFIELLNTKEIMKILYLLFVIQKIKSNSKIFKNLLQKHKENFNIDLLMEQDFIRKNIKKISIMMLFNLYNNNLFKEYINRFKKENIDSFDSLNNWFNYILNNLEKIIVQLTADKIFLSITNINNSNSKKESRDMNDILTKLDSNIIERILDNEFKEYVDLYRKYNSKYALDYMYISNKIDELWYLILFVYLNRKEADLVKKLDSIPNDILNNIISKLSKKIWYNITKNKLCNFLYYINKSIIKTNK